MLYESNYNQYFLEHSWGPWKKHLYISREGESGRFTYKYPKEYYDKYKTNSTRVEGYESGKRADENAAYYDSYYNGVDKVINRSVKAAVKALNFGLDMKDKAENYLNRFGNAVANAWNKTKTAVSSFASAGKTFLKGTGYIAKTAARVTMPKVAASVQNLIKGAGEAVSKGWNSAKEGARKAGETVKTAASNAKTAVTNTVNNLTKKKNYAGAGGH